MLGIIDMAGSVGGSPEDVRPGRLGRPGSGGSDSGPDGEVGRDCGPVRLSRLPALCSPLLVAANVNVVVTLFLLDPNICAAVGENPYNKYHTGTETQRHMVQNRVSGVLGDRTDYYGWKTS